MEMFCKRQNKTMMKIFKSLAIIVAVVAVAGTGTYALYRSEKKVNNVTLGAMTFDFEVSFLEDDSSSATSITLPVAEPIELGELGPGDGDTGLLKVKNTSFYNGNLSMKIDVTGNYENGIDSQEALVDDTYVGSGELCNSVKLRIWDGETLKVNWTSLADFGTRNVGMVPAGAEDREFKIDYEIPSGVGNEILSDTCKFNATFVLDQIEGFVPRSN